MLKNLLTRRTNILRACIWMKNHFTQLKASRKCQFYCLFNVVLAKSLAATIRNKETLFFLLFVISKKFNNNLHFIRTDWTQILWRILRPCMGNLFSIFSCFWKNEQWLYNLKTRKMKIFWVSVQFRKSYQLLKAWTSFQNLKLTTGIRLRQLYNTLRAFVTYRIVFRIILFVFHCFHESRMTVIAKVWANNFSASQSKHSIDKHSL